MEENAQPLPRIQTQGSRYWERGFRCTLGIKTTPSFSLAFTYLLNFLFFSYFKSVGKLKDCCLSGSDISLGIT